MSSVKSPKSTVPGTKKGKKDPKDDYSPEDLKLKEDFANYVEKIVSLTELKLTKEQLQEQKDSILAISKEMREATASMTAIPKPLKFLREHIPTLREYYKSRTTPQQSPSPTTTIDDVILPGNIAPVPIADAVVEEQWENKVYLADLLSVVSMVIQNEHGLVLKYRYDAINGDVENFDLEDVFKWGINYVQNLTAEIAREYVRINNQLSLTDESDKNISSNPSDNDDDNDGDDNDDDKFDELGQIALTNTQSQMATLAGAPKLTTTSMSGHQSSSTTTTTTTSTTMGDSITVEKKEDEKKEGSDDKKEGSNDDQKKTTEDDKKKSERDAMGRKKELSDEEKTAIEAEELRLAKIPTVILPPVTTATIDQLRKFSIRFLPHLFAHGCEIDAVDMLFETENIISISDYIDNDNYAVVLQYVSQSNLYNNDNPQQVNSLLINLYLRLKQWSYALTTALKLTTTSSRIRATAHIFYVARDTPHIQLQLSHMLSQYTSYVSYLCLDTLDDNILTELNQIDDVYIEIITDFPIVTDYRAVEVLQKGSCGVLSDKILQELGVTKGKSRDDVCRVDSEREEPFEWLAVGFANAGTRIIDVLDSSKSPAAAAAAADSTSFTPPNKSTTQAANLILAKGLATGLIYMGDVDEGYSQVDPYLNPSIEEGSSTGQEQKEQSIIGGVVATSLCGSGITNDFNAGLALLSDYCTDSEQYSTDIRITAIQSLGISAIATRNEELRELLIPILLDNDLNDMGRATTALSIALVFLGSCDITLTELLVAAMSEMKETPAAIRLTCLACGLLVFKQRTIPDEITALWNTLEEQNGEQGLKPSYINYLGLVCNLCSHIGDGPMELIQELLRSLSQKSKVNKEEQEDDEDDDDDFGLGALAGLELDSDGEPIDPATKTAEPPVVASPPPAATSPVTTPPTSPAQGEAAAPAAPVTAPATDKSKLKKVSLTSATADSKKNIKNGKNGSIINGNGKNQIDQKASAGEVETDLILRSLVVISMAFFSLSDDLTQQCTTRILSHLLECGSAEVRAAVPLAMSILNISHPSPGLTDHLIRLTHDIHAPLAINSVLAIGLTAAGSNNSRSLSGISGFISETYDQQAIKIGRISQGLVMLGQGTLTLSTSLYNNQVLNERSVVGLMLILIQMLEPNQGLCSKLPIWTILPSCARPKVLITKIIDNDEPEGDSNDVQIPVKMGQVQGGVIMGRKTVLSGIQVTHTPVVIGVGSYVQVDDDDFNALSHCLEGTVLVTKRTMG